MIVLTEVKNGQRKDWRTNNSFRKTNYCQKVSFCKICQENCKLTDLVNGVRGLHLDIHGHEEGEEEENPAGQSQQLAGRELRVGTNLWQERT